VVKATLADSTVRLSRMWPRTRCAGCLTDTDVMIGRREQPAQADRGPDRPGSERDGHPFSSPVR